MSITTKFNEILLIGFRGVAVKNCFSSMCNFGQISKFKNGVTPIKKMNKNFLWICASTHYVLYKYKISRKSVERFQRSWMTNGFKSLGLINRKFHAHGKNDGFVLYEYIIKQCSSYCKYTNISKKHVSSKQKVRYVHEYHLVSYLIFSD